MMRVLAPRPGALIVGTGAATPASAGVGTEYDNDGIHRLLLGEAWRSTLAERGWDADNPERRWGVSRRSWIDSDDLDVSAGATTLAAAALTQALDEAAVGPDRVDLLLAATSTPTQVSKVQAAMIGKRLGIHGPCIDVRAGGAGAIDALLLGARMLGDDLSTVAVVSAETASLYVDRTDLSMSTLYADAAAAVVLRHEPHAGAGFAGGVLGRRDAPGRPFTIPGDLPPSATALADGAFRFQKPDATYGAALDDAWREACAGLADALPRAVAGASAFVPYAITRSQVEAATAALGTDPTRTVSTLADHGCVGCPSPLVGLDRARRTGVVGRGDVVATAAVAGGVTMASMLWTL